MKIATATAVTLLLGAAAPFALSTPAIASAHPVEVTFSDPLAAELGLEDGVVIELPFSLAAEVCPDLTDETSCDATTTTDDLDEFIEELDDDDGDDNSARQYAPGQLKEDGESAREYAPGQMKEDGESAKESAPGQQKKSDD